jgi:predicted MFS family arabinose efflux permease
MSTGSLVGGSIADAFGYGAVALAAAGVTWAFTLLVLMPFLPNIGGAESLRTKRGTSPGVLAALSMLRDNPDATRLVLVTSVFGAGMSLYRSTFGIAVADHFGLSATASGRLTSYGALVSMVTNVAVIGTLVARIGDRGVILFAILMQCVAFALLTVAHTAAHLMFLMVPMGLAGTVAYTVITSQMTEVVSKEDAGKAVALRHVIGSVTGLVTPPLGAWVVEKHGFDRIGWICAFASAASALLYLPAALGPKKRKRA